MMRRALSLCICLSLTLALAACETDTSKVASTQAELIIPPTVCAPDEPTCFIAEDHPEQLDLTITNSSNLISSGAGGAGGAPGQLQLTGSSGVLFDDDGDGVANEADDCAGLGWRMPCDGDPSNDGLTVVLEYDAIGQVELGAEINVTAAISAADVYILMDVTGSMSGEHQALVSQLISGDFIDPALCAGAAGTGLVGAMRCVVPDVQYGVGQFHEYPVDPHGNPFEHTPYHHHLDITDDIGDLVTAVSNLMIRSNNDYPEAGSQALYSIVTGQGLGPWVPNRAPCANGGWGYPCFRPGAMPIILVFTDAEMINGPPGGTPNYSSPTDYDPLNFATLGLGTNLPPLEQDPGMLQADNSLDAFYLGQLDKKSVSVMGTTANNANSFFTSKGACKYCPPDPMKPCVTNSDCSTAPGTCNLGTGLCDPPSCWTDGLDGAVWFTLKQDQKKLFMSAEGAFFPSSHVALFKDDLEFFDCDPGPGAGNNWGQLNVDQLDKGDWYLVADARLAPTDSINSRRGPYQLRVVTTNSKPDWRTADTPVLWTDVETELLASGVKVISVISENRGGYVGIPDYTQLAIITDSLDKDGKPYLQTIPGNGTGLGTAVLDALRSLAGDTRRDVTIIAEDNPTTPLVDESLFAKAIIAVDCQTTGLANCTGGEGTDTCTDCLADTRVSFRFRLGNDIVPQTTVTQVFDFDMVGLTENGVELRRFPVRVIVPPMGTAYGSGYYQNTYDASTVCQIPPDRPDWGTLTWDGSIPAGTNIEIEIFTDDVLANLDTQVPLKFAFDGTTPPPVTIDVGDELEKMANLGNYRPYLRIRARLQASPDGLQTPTLDNWKLVWDCVPFE
jgi:hypothetical protein